MEGTRATTVDYDARYSKGWAYGKAANPFLCEVAVYLPALEESTHRFFSSESEQSSPPLHSTELAEPGQGAPSLSPLQVISLGEGQGRNVVYLAGQGHHCVAVDASAVGVFATEASNMPAPVCQAACLQY